MSHVAGCGGYRSASAGEAVAKRRRMPSGKAFDFFVESSFVELHNECCRDLYSKAGGPAVAANLPVSGAVAKVSGPLLVHMLIFRSTKGLHQLAGPGLW